MTTSFFIEKFCISDKKRTFASRLLSKFEKILSGYALLLCPKWV